MGTRVKVLKWVFAIECCILIVLLLSKMILSIDETNDIMLLEYIRMGANIFMDGWRTIICGVFGSFLTTLVIYYVEYNDLKTQSINDFCDEVYKLANKIEELPFPYFRYSERYMIELLKELHSNEIRKMRQENQGRPSVKKQKEFLSIYGYANGSKTKSDAINRHFEIMCEEINDVFEKVNTCYENFDIKDLENAYRKICFLSGKSNKKKEEALYNEILVEIREKHRYMGFANLFQPKENGYGEMVIRLELLEEYKEIVFEENTDLSEEGFQCYYNKLKYDWVWKTNKVLCDLQKREFLEPNKGCVFGVFNEKYLQRKGNIDF